MKQCQTHEFHIYDPQGYNHPDNQPTINKVFRLQNTSL